MHADQLFPIYRSQPGVQPRHSHARHSNAPHPYAPDRVSKAPRGFQGLLIVLGTRVPSKFAQRVNFENPWGLRSIIIHEQPGRFSLCHGPSPAFNLQSSTFNRLHLILEKKKIQITIEEQMLKPPFLCFSPVSGRPSIVHGPSPIVDFQSKRSGATFNRRIVPRIANSKKQKQIKCLSPTYVLALHRAPTYTGLGRKTARIESILY